MDLISQVLVDWTPEISTAQKIYPRGEKVHCYQCNIRLTQDLYFFSYDYCLCKSCYQIPYEIRHWLHPQHSLLLQTKQLFTILTSNDWYDVFSFICDGCLYVSFGRVYVCQDCDFRCCIDCSLSIANRMPIEWDHDKDSIFHYIHLHELTRCRYKPRLDVKNTECLICELPIWGICYGCVRCACFIHASCVDAPEQILHPVHPFHPLNRLNYALDYSIGDVCKGCSKKIWGKKHFFCDECQDFSLELKCADALLRTIQHELHPHALTYSTPQVSASDARCDICYESVSRRHVPFYHCVQCDLTFHFRCIPIPPTFSHRYHMHPLSLVDSFLEADGYCSICETSRKPYEHAYCCTQCSFVAHIECVLSQEEITSKILSCLSHAATYAKASMRIGTECSTNDPHTQTQIRHMGHNHQLSLLDAPTDLKYCTLCNLEIDDPTYACQQCDFWVHKKCVELPQELEHPLHGCRSLTLLKNYRLGRTFMCSLCRDVSDTFCFLCRVCGYIIDVKCAFATQDIFSTTDMEHRRELVHPVFGHLQLVNPTGKYALMNCKVCNQKISGLRYSLLNTDGGQDCKFFHVSCIELPLKVKQHPLHPNHTLSLISLGNHYSYSDNPCGACGYTILAFGYRCEEKCPFTLHIECAHSLSRLLKHEVHHHRLYYFQERPSNIGVEPTDRRPRRRRSTSVCYLCGRRIKGSYYRCVDCKLNFHLRCLRLPRIVKHKWHLHPLVYKESIGFGGFYCDICEEERDGQHPVYCCEDCRVVAHVDCLVSEENACSVVIEEIKSQDVECGSDASEEIENEDRDASGDDLSDASEEIENGDRDAPDDDLGDDVSEEYEGESGSSYADEEQ